MSPSCGVLALSTTVRGAQKGQLVDLAVQLTLWPPCKVVTVTDRKHPWAPSSHLNTPQTQCGPRG